MIMLYVCYRCGEIQLKISLPLQLYISLVYCFWDKITTVYEFGAYSIRIRRYKVAPAWLPIVVIYFIVIYAVFIETLALWWFRS